ncbi:hypothetical protein SERLA73DRAFT_150345 [Serpula lacrymans var. lacrymans S7.3]|uniref:Retrotransposon gag domain-containing protein n=1 Tax=Serpula lacrymans var. lacrymans (strain S7.3) TaxID=936435 RepID=F8PM70_SERL3|nr:hypothetical protein SERLA73DRAFT_150345 [Serpula lacrymans var. lacrymans S7.3]
MLAQEQTVDINAILYRMWERITNLTAQLEEIQNAQSASTIDPGTFKRDQAKCAEWWIKLQIRIKANWDVFVDDFEIGRQHIHSFKQGNMRTDDFVTWFLALSIQGGLGNEHAVELLECNVSPAIAQQLYLQDMRNKDLSAAAEEVHKIINLLFQNNCKMIGGQPLCHVWRTRLLSSLQPTTMKTSSNKDLPPTKTKMIPASAKGTASRRNRSENLDWTNAQRMIVENSLVVLNIADLCTKDMPQAMKTNLSVTNGGNHIQQFQCVHLSWWNRYSTSGHDAPAKRPDRLVGANQSQFLPYLSSENE